MTQSFKENEGYDRQIPRSASGYTEHCHIEREGKDLRRGTVTYDMPRKVFQQQNTSSGDSCTLLEN